jgi:hypothetical protein
MASHNLLHLAIRIHGNRYDRKPAMQMGLQVWEPELPARADFSMNEIALIAAVIDALS